MRGIPADRILPIERSEALVKLLKRRFPSLNIVLGDATELGSLLKTLLPQGRARNQLRRFQPAVAVRSRERVVTSILREVHNVLPKHGKLVQY